MLHLSKLTSPFLRHRFDLNRCGQVVILGLTLFTITSYAQGGFVSGSTGADGALNPTTNVTVQLPESGVLNYTTVNIPAGVTVRFGKNSRNTPVTILATGNVTIAGVFDVSGQGGADVLGGAGGPGGFNGGNGGPSTNNNSVFSPGVNGDGPGGGGGGGSSSPNSPGGAGGGGFANPGQDGVYANSFYTVVNGKGGPRYGLPSLIPLIGGSGGGGDVGAAGGGGGGGGGGGAILIASSGTISFTSNPSTISVRGGAGVPRTVGAGSGSGGAVRLIANVITGTLAIEAQGGSFGGGGVGSGGYIRLEAFDITGLQLNGLSGSPRVSIATPKAAIPPNLPTIRIASIAGITPPAQPNGTLQGGPDITLPANQPNPVTVALTASNIPLGAILQVTLTPENGLRVVTQSSALSGTLAASTASASISVPDGICVIQASGTIDVASSAMMINGERVKTIEVTATFGGKPTVTYVTTSNKRIRVED